MPTVSHSWKASLPIAVVGTWPVMATIGIESMKASISGVTRFVAAGPDVTMRHAGTAGDVGVALGHVAGALLVAHEDVADRRLEQRVVGRQDAAAGQAEHDLHRLLLEALDEGLGAGEFHGERAPGRRVRADGTRPKSNRPPGSGGRGRTRRVRPVRYRMSTRASGHGDDIASE